MQQFKSHANSDQELRKAKANKILKIIHKFGVKKDSKLLEIGTGSGIITNELSKYFKINSVDVIDERVIKSGFKFKKIEDTNLPFKDNSFDLIISNQVIEHVNDYNNHLKEIYRCLKSDGLCYLATPNKWAIFEAHYMLPLLSWLPKSLADTYLIIFKKRKYDVYPLGYSKLIKCCKLNKFKIKHLSLDVLRNPKKFGLENKYSAYSKIIRLLPRYSDNILKRILPSWIFILKK